MRPNDWWEERVTVSLYLANEFLSGRPFILLCISIIVAIFKQFIFQIAAAIPSKTSKSPDYSVMDFEFGDDPSCVYLYSIPTSLLCQKCCTVLK